MPPRPSFASRWIYALAGAKLGAQLIAVIVSPYGFHRDEFLYLAMGDHLRLFSMDFPPFIAILANFTRATLGDSLFAIRFWPAVAGTVIVLMAALIARELGGRKPAQILAAIAVILNPLFLRSACFFMPVVFDQLWWTLGLYAMLRLVRTGEPRWWIRLGVACGLGLLTKFSIAFFGLGVLAGLILSRDRKYLATPWPYVTLLIALILGSPCIIGQINLGFPIIPQLSGLQESQLALVTPLSFLISLLMMLGPALILAVVGQVYLLRARSMKSFRATGWTTLVTLLVIMLLRGKAYYVGPLFPFLLAAGSVGIEALATRPRRIAVIAAYTLVGAYGLFTLPFGLPVVPPAPMARYAAAVGLTEATTTNSGEVIELPQDYADMLGWEERVAAVAAAYHSLPPQQQSVAVILARNYGEAGALDHFGRRHDLPRALCIVGSYWFFGPGELPGEVVVSLGFEPEELRDNFDSITVASRVDIPRTVPEERNVPVLICMVPNFTFQEIWPRFANRPSH